MIDERHLLSLDLNLLLLLKIIGEERNSRKAAERMFVTQSTVSKGLKKLRHQLGDDMFVRNKNGLEPTEYCEQILEQLPDVINSIGEMLSNKADVFDDTFSGSICIAISPTFYKPYSTAIIRHFNSLVPNATLKIVNWTWQTENDLINKNVHLAINYYPLDISKSIIQKPVCDIDFKFCVRKEHPLTKSPHTLSEFSHFPLVLAIQPSFANQKSHVERIFDESGLQTRVSFQSDQITLCYEKLKISDGFMPIHSGAKQELPAELQLIDIPFDELPFRRFGIYYPTPSKEAKITRWLAQEVSSLLKRFN
ncbi:LysR family transcriptional regulator [Vibrio lamellibrachiae]|uniref:LysR family transcriptional regulator n=1 Tax=Vibrio lamellibrachiae TaxID=2910253 RepID=UPI003D095CCC